MEEYLESMYKTETEYCDHRNVEFIIYHSEDNLKKSDKKISLE